MDGTAFFMIGLSESKIEIGIERNVASVNYNFYSYLLGAFNYFDIEYDIIFTVPRSIGTIYNAVSVDDFVFFIRAKGKNEYYLVPPGMYTIANSFPSQFEGQEAFVFKNTTFTGSFARSSLWKNFLTQNLHLTIRWKNWMSVSTKQTLSN